MSICHDINRSVLSHSLQPHGLWTTACYASTSITNSQSLFRLMSMKSVKPSTHLILCRPLLPPPFNLSQHQGLFQWVNSLHQVAKVLEFQLQHQSFQWVFRADFLYDGLVGYPCSPRDSQESSSTPQFKNINSLPFSLLYGPTLTSIHGYWKNLSFDYADLNWQSDISAF